MGVMIRAFEGNLNLDVSPYRLPKGDYIGAENITRDSQASGNDLVVSNIVGNRLVEYTGYFPDTTNICIGAYNDDIKNRVIYFVWNSGGYHSILLYDNASRTITKILESITDTTNVDILNFQLLYKVNNINVIHRDEDGDLLLWNDAYNRPGQINIDDFIAGIYGNLVTDDLIRLAKRPPLDDIIPVYESDASILVNNLKRKLFQFAYAWIYTSGEISTISPTSAVVLPYNAYAIETESDPGQNNIIKLPLVAGGADCKFIRIFGRQNIGSAWGDWFIIDTVDMSAYGILPGNTYEYKFLNDGQYTIADQLYIDLLFDYCADKCNAQTLVNGNVIVQGAITEGLDNIPQSSINVQLGIDLKDTNSSGTTPANPTITVNSYDKIPPYPPLSPGANKITDFTIGASIAPGCQYNIQFHVPVYGGSDYNPTATYTSVTGDTPSNVAQALATSLNAQMNPVSPPAKRGASYVAPNIIRVENTVYQIDSIITSATSPVFFTGGSGAYKWGANYLYGLVYVDKYGKSNGVVSFISTPDSLNDFSVTTPNFRFNTTIGDPYYGNPQLPIVLASISHLPPDWAVSYYWVRTPNLTTNSFLEYITAEIQSDANYWYFCIENLDVFKEDNTGFIPSYTFKNGDRLRVYAKVVDTPEKYQYYSGNVLDYEILGEAEREMTGGTTKGRFLKIKKVPGSPVYADRVFIEVYTPLERTSQNNQVVYEFGECYPIYIDSITGIHYHRGGQQDQTASQPATFKFENGDVYYKFRDFYKLAGGTIDPTTIYQKGVMDANYSDYWASAINSNGTAWVINPNAKRLFNPVLTRFSQAYQPGTDINGLNRFYPGDFDEYFRDYGAIMNFSIRDKMLHVYQKLKVGRVPVFGQIIKDTGGNEQLVVSDRLLNTIQYYIGNYGIGDHPESLASNNYADYFLSNIRGVYCRLSQNGLEPISISHNINNFAVTELGGRDFNYKCYGVFDAYNNLYITALEETPNLPAKTLQWNEQRNGFESFLSYKPEMMVCLNQMLITFKDGQLYTHDNYGQYNTFYGTTYDSSITPVFNDNIVEKKTWQNVTELASNVWDIPEIITNVKSGIFPNQLSKIIESNFTYLEGEFNAVFKRDQQSPGGVGNGQVLKGSYVTMKFRKAQPTTLEFLNLVTVGFIDSPVTNRQ